MAASAANRVARRLAAALFGATLVAACVTGTIQDSGGGGNEATGSSSSGQGGATSSGDGGSTTSVGGGGGGDLGCMSAEQCPGLDTTCRYRSCAQTVCGFEEAAATTACSEDGGQLCDGLGDCVECVADGDCSNGVCQQNLCVPATCTDGMQNGDETAVDCGGACAPCGNGVGCVSGSDCVSGYCNNGTCAACSSDSHCGNNRWCNAGTCDDEKTNGAVCSAANECSSGFCPGQDGVCCDGACSGSCQACLAGKTGGQNGSCTAVAGTTDPDGECSAQGAASCGANGNGCNGNTTSPGCNLYPSGTSCSTASCSSGQQTTAGTCNGNGNCSGGATTPCAPYVCGQNSCLTSCNGNNDCSGANTCQGGLCGLSGCGGAGPGTTPLDSEEQQMLVLVNNHRANNSLGPLTACTSLNRTAQGHSEDMRDQDYFSHTGLNNSTPWDRACNACYALGCGPMTAMAENIAAGNSTAAGTFNQWLNSPGHNANMLGSNFTQLGIGRATGGGTYGSYWTQVFGGQTEPSCN